MSGSCVQVHPQVYAFQSRIYIYIYIHTHTHNIQTLAKIHVQPEDSSQDTCAT